MSTNGQLEAIMPERRTDDGGGYTLREMLDRLERKLDDVRQHMDTKASASAISDMYNQLDILEKRVTAMETVGAVNKGISDYRTWLIGVVIVGVLSSLVSVAGLIISFLKGH